MSATDIRQDSRYLEMLRTVHCAKDFEVSRSCDYIIKGLLDRQQTALISGPPNCGKTFWLLSLKGHVAAGLPTFFGMKVRRMPALYFCAEGSVTKLENRFIAWCQHHHIDHRNLPFAVLHYGLNLLGRADGAKSSIVDLDRICELIRHYRQHWGESPLVSLDTVTAVAPGGNLNQPSDSSLITDSLRSMRVATGNGAVIGVHHSPQARPGDAAGHHNFSGQPDVAIGITEGAGGIRTVTSPKQRDSAKLGNLHFVLPTVDLGSDVEGDPLTTCVAVPHDGLAPARHSSAADAKADRALQVLRVINNGAGADFGAWLEECRKGSGIINSDASKGTADRALRRLAKALIAAGKVEKSRRGFYVPTASTAQ